MNQVVIYTDGACKGNPGPGGWGVLLRSGAVEKELFGGELGTTNNRMELIAVIEALSALKRPCAVTLYLDSEYVRKGITEWIHGWKARGWRTAAWMHWLPVPVIASTGAGCGGIRAIRATSAPMPWRTAAWKRPWGAAEVLDHSLRVCTACAALLASYLIAFCAAE